MSAETRKERASDWEYNPGVGDSLWRSDGIRDDSAPVVDTLPISSWLKSAMQFTFPLNVSKLGLSAWMAIASTAQYLNGGYQMGSLGLKSGCAYDENMLSRRGLKMNSLPKPPKTEGWVS